MLRVAWYRFRATFGAGWGGYLSIVLLTGLVGGLAMGAIAGARRTQSSFPAFLRSTHPADLVLPTALYGLNGAKTGYDPVILRKISHLPQVRRVESAGIVNNAALQPSGAEIAPPPGAQINVGSYASIDGRLFDQDAVTVLQGRRADPRRANELMISAGIARALDLHPGSVLPFGFYTNAQELKPGPSGSEWRPHPYLRIDMKIVGIGVANNAIVQDDVDASGAEFALFTPALASRLTQCCTQDTLTGLDLARGSRDLPAVESELYRINPLVTSHFYVSSIDEAKAERTIEPESIALAVFGFIAALAALLIASQVIGRQLRARTEELDVLRALGASPAMTTAEGLVGGMLSVAAGTGLAVGVAVALSPLFPIGAARRVYPTRGIAFDWTVLGLGALVLVVALGATAFTLAYRQAPHRAARRTRLSRARRSTAARLTGAVAVPAPVATGVRFALEPGRGRNTVPVRSAIFGAALAMVVVVGTLTFGTSLHRLVSHPSLYGWNWDYELSGGGGVGAVPQVKSAAALARDHDVAASSGVYFGSAQIDDLEVPLLVTSSHAAVGPPLLSGHALAGADQIVLGANTLSALHKHLGQFVELNGGAPKPVRLRIVGTATMPAIGASSSDQLHTEMGIGAVIDTRLVPASLLNDVGNVPTGPNVVLVRLRPGVDRAAARRTLDHIAAGLSLPTNYGVSVQDVQHPAEIINYRSMSGTPLLLGAALAVGAVAALALILITSVRRRRHDLALLKTLGFTRRQLAAVVGWQSTIAVGLGTIVGVPVGIVAGRSLWDLFARQIHAIPDPSVPALTITLIAIGALVLANVVAAIPGRQAARTQTAVLLRAE